MNVDVTIEIRSLVSEAPKHFKLAMASRRAAFSGNTALIATFSSSVIFHDFPRVYAYNRSQHFVAFFPLRGNTHTVGPLFSFGDR